MDKNRDWVIVGRFGRPHGIKGFVKVLSFTEPADNILQYHDWHANIKNQWQPLKILQVEVNDKFILVQVEGYQEREQAAYLTNVDIAVKHEQLPELQAGEYYWHQLIGMQVVNQEGIDYGQVVEVFATGSNDVLVVMGDKRRLIPYLPGQVVLDVNDTKRVITVDWDMDF